MKKNLLNVLLLAAAVFSLGSCVSEVDDVFDKPSSERIAEAIQNDFNILTSAANGWEMYMYGDMTYGGWSLLCKFNTDNTVTVASNAFNEDEAATTHFKIEQSAGVVLSFDEYNEIFHFFSDPVNPAGIGGIGYGLECDLEFRIISATPERVVMKGKKTENNIIMVPIKQGVDWEKYISSLQEWEEAMNEFGLYYCYVGDKQAEVSVGTHTFDFTYTDENGIVTRTSAPFAVKEGGVILYDTLKVFGANVTEFDFNKDTYEYSANGGAVTMVPYIPPINEQFAATYWYTSLSNIGAFGTPYWNAIKNQIMPLLEEDLRLFVFGAAIPSWAASWADYWGASFNSGGYGGGLNFKYTLIGEDQIKMSYDSAGNQGNGAWYVQNGYFHYLIVPFGTNTSGAAVERTFTITTDNIKKPTWIKLTDNDNADNVITLYSDPISYPFEN